MSLGMRRLEKGSLVLVTGGAGFIGAHLVRKLLAARYRVRVLDDLSIGHEERLAGMEVELRVDDLRSERATRSACEGVAAVAHLAAPHPHPRTAREERIAHDITTTGTLNLLSAARDAGASRFVFASSSTVYGSRSNFLLHEDLPPSPTCAEGAQKLAAESYVKLFAARDGLSACSLRFFAVYGPGQDDTPDDGADASSFVSRFVHAALAGKPAVIYGDGQQLRDLLHVDDAAAALLSALTTPGLTGRAINVAAGETVSVRDVLALVAELAGGMPPPRYLPPAQRGACADKDVRASVAAAGSQLGFRARTRLRDGLAAWLAAANKQPQPRAAPPKPEQAQRPHTTLVSISATPLAAPVLPVNMAPMPQPPRASGQFPTTPGTAASPRLPAVQSTPLFADRLPSWDVDDDDAKPVTGPPGSSAVSSPALPITDADMVPDLDDGWTL